MTYFLMTGAMALLSYYMAEKRGRSPLLGIVGGILFGVFAPIYYLCVGDSKELREAKFVAAIQNIKNSN